MKNKLTALVKSGIRSLVPNILLQEITVFDILFIKKPKNPIEDWAVYYGIGVLYSLGTIDLFYPIILPLHILGIWPI